jgi:hypothetical protein
MLRQQMDPEQGQRFDAFAITVLNKGVINRVSLTYLHVSPCHSKYDVEHIYTFG